MTKQTNNNKSVETVFHGYVKKALENYNDPLWLGQHSPLAVPYLIAEHVNNSSRSVNEDERRGLALQQLMGQATIPVNGKIKLSLRGLRRR